MRTYVPLLVVAAWCVPALSQAQEKKFLPPEIKKIQVGFKTFRDDESTIYKVGLWTPIYVEVFGGTDGVALKPSDREAPYIKIATTDSEDVGTEIKVPQVIVEPMKSRTFLGYVKAGHLGRTVNEIRVTLHASGRQFSPPQFDPASGLQVDNHVYLAIGSRMTDFHNAVKGIGKQRRGDKKGEKGEKVEEIEDFGGPTGFRNVVFETDVDRLPERWFGYNNVDLIVLATENKKFLTALNLQPERLAALADWVRRGGRLVVPVAPQNQDVIAAVLTNAAAWQPAIPVVPPAAPQPFALEELAGISTFAGIPADPLVHKNPKDPRNLLPIPIATLEPAKVLPGAWEPGGYNDDKPGSRPLFAHVRYGLGKITYFAISLEDTSFFQWKGKQDFYEQMVLKLATKAPKADPNNQNFGGGGINFRDTPDDLSTQLVNSLDQFDVRIIEFGYVALFIVLYIIVVGPLDFVLLKYVFKRLEWTWITFPTVVLAVSVIAYFAAYALKGRDLKINKVDIVDFDMRTDVDAKGQPKSVRAYGTSFFTILSPRIQNYTVGMEANPNFWGEEVKKADENLSVDLMSWMGRPSGGPNDMGRGGGSGGFFRNAYSFRDDASGLIGVPIPVWTTKSFTASWERPVAKPPLVAELFYHQKDPQNKQIRVSGKLENHFGVDLVDVWLIYDKKAYAINGGLKAMRNGADPKEGITLTAANAKDINGWYSMIEVPDTAPEPRAGNCHPTNVVKDLLFHELKDAQNVGRNHLLRPLDLSWRVQEAPAGQIDHKPREAILFARVRFQTGQAETLTRDKDTPLATKLWIGDLPDAGKSRPPLDGILYQDTFVRVLLQLRPADE